MADQSWYETYLESSHWRRLRARKLEQRDYTCERCGERGTFFDDVWYGLQVHHLTYERRGHEFLTDLEVLCTACHKIDHGLAEESDRRSIQKRENDKIVRRLIEMSARVDDDITLEIASWDSLDYEAGLF